MRKLSVAMAAVLAGPVLAWLPGGAGAQEADVKLTIALPEEPPTLDICAIGSNAAARVLFGNVGEGLTERDPESGEVKPLLATAWKQTAPTVWEFTLREGVTFHDGTAFDAKAAAASIARTFTKELNCSVASQAFGVVRLTSEAVDDRTLRITTSQEDPILPVRASFLGMTAPGTQTDRQTETPIGTGPYKFVTWDHGSQIVLERSEKYWGDKPAVTDVTYLFRDEDIVRAEMISTGEADIAIGLPPEYSGSEGAIQFDIPETVLLRMHTFSEPFRDIRVRRAVVHAIDREGLIAAVWNGAAEVASQPVTSGIDGYNETIEVPKYDPDAARKLVEEAKAAGVPTDTQATIYARPDLFANADLLAQGMAEQLNAVGLNIVVQSLEAAPWIEILRGHPSDRPGFLLESHNNVLGDASWTANSRFHSSQPRSQIPEAERAKVDAMVVEAGSALGDERTKAYQELFAYITDAIVQDAYIAYLKSVMILGEGIEYTPNSQTNDIFRISAVKVTR